MSDFMIDKGITQEFQEKDLKQLRSGESKYYPFRTERYYRANNGWYFLIRGGAVKGPFTEREDAESAAKRYMETQDRLTQAFNQIKKEPF